MKSYINKYIYVLSLSLIPLLVQCKSEVQYVDTKTVMAVHSKKENGYKFKLGTEMKANCTTGQTGDLTYLNPLPKEGEPQPQIIKYDKCQLIKATLTRLKADKSSTDYEIEVTATIDKIEQKAKDYFCPVPGATVADCNDAKYATSLLYVMAYTFGGEEGKRQVKVGDEEVTYEQAVYDMRTQGLKDRGIVYEYIPFNQMRVYNYTTYSAYIADRTISDTEFAQLSAKNFYAKTWLSVLASYMIFNHLEKVCREEDEITTFDSSASFTDVEPLTNTTKPKKMRDYCAKEMKQEPEAEVVSDPSAGDRMRVKVNAANVYVRAQEDISHEINTDDGKLILVDRTIEKGSEIIVNKLVTIIGKNEKMVMFELFPGSGFSYIHLTNLEKVTAPTTEQPQSTALKATHRVKKAGLTYNVYIYNDLENYRYVSGIELNGGALIKILGNSVPGGPGTRWQYYEVDIQEIFTLNSCDINNPSICNMIKTDSSFNSTTPTTPVYIRSDQIEHISTRVSL